MNFIKLSATGNDFIFIENKKIYPSFVSEVLDEHVVGADGLILLSNSKTVDILVKFYNKDGSEAAICGNGLRAISYYLKNIKKIDKNVFFVETISGVMRIGYEEESDDYFAVFSKPELINYDKSEALVKTKNLHWLKRVEFIDLNELMDEALPLINSLNFHQIRLVTRKQIEMASFERGVGLTKSCGSGAIAAFYYMKLLKLIEDNIIVKCRGGKLNVKMENEEIVLLGKVKLLFKGTISK